jgi:hypothetical protein
MFIFTYEGYLTFIVDIVIFIIAAIAYTTLHPFVHEIEHLLETGCIDEDTSGMLSVYKTATGVVADKNFEIFLIILTKMTLISISIVYTCWYKKGRVKFRQIEEIIFEKEEEEHEPHGENHDIHQHQDHNNPNNRVGEEGKVENINRIDDNAANNKLRRGSRMSRSKEHGTTPEQSYITVKNSERTLNNVENINEPRSLELTNRKKQ